MSEFNFKPELDYAGLLKQANAMALLVRAMEKTKTFQDIKIGELCREFTLQGYEEINAQRETNNKLTDEIEKLEQRLAAAEAKNTELEKELFVLSSDVIYCGCGHVTSGLQEKAKRIYGKLRESGGEG